MMQEVLPLTKYTYPEFRNKFVWKTKKQELVPIEKMDNDHVETCLLVLQNIPKRKQKPESRLYIKIFDWELNYRKERNIKF